MNKIANCTYKGCFEPVWDGSANGFCLFHSKENDRDEETASLVWEEARRRSQGKRSGFGGWHFPEDPSQLYFTNTSFADTAFFDSAVFNGKVSFKSASFAKLAWFKSTSFSNEANFEYVTFCEHAEFSNALFSDKACFWSATFSGHTSFESAFFSKGANFCYTSFKDSVIFRKATFTDAAGFVLATFFRPVSFKEATFFKIANFGGSNFLKDVSFSLPSTHFECRSPFLISTPFHLKHHGEKPYRASKQAAQNSGDYRMAGEYHFAEQCAIGHGMRRQYGWRPWTAGFWNSLFELLFARGVFGYGEKPVRALGVGALVILYCAGLFYTYNSIAELEEPSFWTSLYFSAVTFTTLGYGDFQPISEMRWLAGLEAFTGAALMALFIVALARKYTR